MIGKIIGAIAGSQAAKHTSSVSEPYGAVAGVVAATLLRRVSLTGMIAIAAGGFLAKKAFDSQQRTGSSMPTAPRPYTPTI